MTNTYLLAAITNPVVGEFGQGNGGSTLGSLIGRLFRTAIMLGGLALLIVIVWGGISWITAGGDEKQVEQARNRITNGIIGMVVLVGAAAIAMFIGSVLGINLLNPSI